MEAALAAESQAVTRRDQVREALVRDLEAARYAADPENRHVAGELEARWNRALMRVTEGEAHLADHDAASPPCLDTAPLSFAALAEDLEAIWTAPTAGTRLKKRIVRTVIEAAAAGLDDETAEIVVVLHWMGGALAEHRLPRRRRGQRNSTPADVVEAVRTPVLLARDADIAGILNRNGLKTGNGNRGARERVTSLRSNHAIPVHRPTEDGIEPWLNLRQAAALVGVAPRTLRVAAARGGLEALHPLANGPWIFNRAMLQGPAAQALAPRVRSNPKHPAVSDPDQQPYSRQRHSEMCVVMSGRRRLRCDRTMPPWLPAGCGTVFDEQARS